MAGKVPGSARSIRGRGLPSQRLGQCGSPTGGGRSRGRTDAGLAADHAAAPGALAHPPHKGNVMTISSQSEPVAVADYDAEWLQQHLEHERRSASVLSEIREAVFGAQDGLTSVLAVVSTVGGATGQAYPVLVAGLAATLAGVFSMAAGEYMSSKSQREIFQERRATPTPARGGLARA